MKKWRKLHEILLRFSNKLRQNTQFEACQEKAGSSENAERKQTQKQTKKSEKDFAHMELNNIPRYQLSKGEMLSSQLKEQNRF